MTSVTEAFGRACSDTGSSGITVLSVTSGSGFANLLFESIMRLTADEAEFCFSGIARCNSPASALLRRDLGARADVDVSTSAAAVAELAASTAA